MPRCEMLKLLLSLIDTSSRQVSTAAARALTEVCQSASGDDGCTLAEQDEINELLAALTRSNADLRFVSLEVGPHHYCSLSFVVRLLFMAYVYMYTFSV